MEVIRVPSTASSGGACLNPNIQEAETGRSLRITGQHCLQSKFQASHSYAVRSCLKTKEESLLPEASNRSLSIRAHRDVFSATLGAPKSEGDSDREQGLR